MFIKKLSLVFSLSLLATAALASEHVVVAPSCLTQQLGGNFTTLSEVQSFSLISVDDNGIEKLISLKDQNKKCGGFMDVTHAWDNYFDNKTVSEKKAKSFLIKYSQSPAKLKAEKNYSIKYESQVKQIHSQINPQNMWDNLTTLSHFQDRYANSDNGVKAANWLKTQIEDMAKLYHRDVVVSIVPTGRNYKQPSVVAKFGSSNEPGIVVGAHMDTLSSMWEKNREQMMMEVVASLCLKLREPFWQVE